MERYIHEQNLAHYRRLLAEPDVANDQTRHVILIRLLSEEKANITLGTKVRSLLHLFQQGRRIVDPPLEGSVDG